MRNQVLTLLLVILVPVVAITAKLYAAQDCDGTIPDSAKACLTGKQSCTQKYTDGPSCNGGIGLLNIQPLVITTHADPGQAQCKTTLTVGSQAVCADQYSCVWLGGECGSNFPVLDKDGKPCHTYATVYTSAGCQAVPAGCNGG